MRERSEEYLERISRLSLLSGRTLARMEMFGHISEEVCEDALLAKLLRGQPED